MFYNIKMPYLCIDKTKELVFILYQQQLSKRWEALKKENYETECKRDFNAAIQH